MTGLIHSLMVLAGLREQKRRPPSARRQRPAQSRGRPAQARTAAKPQPRGLPTAAPVRRHQAGARPDTLFADEPGAFAPAARRSSKASRAALPRPAKSRKVGGLGMISLLLLSLTVGTWLGSEVQALAFGTREERQAEVRDPYAVKQAPADTAASFTF